MSRCEIIGDRKDTEIFIVVTALAGSILVAYVFHTLVEMIISSLLGKSSFNK